METETREPATADLSAAALAEWQLHVEAVLRGIAHSLNNRAAALSAVLELSSDADDDVASTLGILRGEVERVSELARAVRSVGTIRAGADAFSPTDAVNEALAILALHPKQRERRVAMSAAAAPPIRVPRWMFVRALIVFGANASSEVPQARVVLAGEGDWLAVRYDGPAGPSRELTPLVRELAHLMGGDVLSDQCGFRVPTLSALRQREAR
jgi:signal transduction histidine kinase